MDNGEGKDHKEATVKVLGETKRPAQLSSLPDLLAFVSGHARSEGFSETRIGQIGEGLAESLSNTIVVAHRSEPGEIRITCEVDGEHFSIVITDFGPPFNILLADDPFFSDSKRKEAISTKKMRRFIDSIEYERQPYANVLTLTVVKKVPGAGV